MHCQPYEIRGHVWVIIVSPLGRCHQSALHDKQSWLCHIGDSNTQVDWIYHRSTADGVSTLDNSVLCVECQRGRRIGHGESHRWGCRQRSVYVVTRFIAQHTSYQQEAEEQET